VGHSDHGADRAIVVAVEAPLQELLSVRKAFTNDVIAAVGSSNDDVRNRLAFEPFDANAKKTSS
jgi:hypothetical protein